MLFRENDRHLEVKMSLLCATTLFAAWVFNGFTQEADRQHANTKNYDPETIYYPGDNVEGVMISPQEVREYFPNLTIRLEGYETTSIRLDKLAKILSLYPSFTLNRDTVFLDIHATRDNQSETYGITAILTEGDEQTVVFSQDPNSASDEPMAENQLSYDLFLSIHAAEMHVLGIPFDDSYSIMGERLAILFETIYNPPVVDIAKSDFD